MEHDDLALLGGDSDDDFVVISIARSHLDGGDGLTNLTDDAHQLQLFALKHVDASCVGPKDQEMSRAIKAGEADA